MLQWPSRLPAPFLLPVRLLCARNTQTMLLPFRGNPQNVQASVQGGCFGRGYTAPVPGPSSPPQACAALLVAQAHQKQQESKVQQGLHEPKTYIYVVGGASGGAGRRSSSASTCGPCQARTRRSHCENPKARFCPHCHGCPGTQRLAASCKLLAGLISTRSDQTPSIRPLSQ